MGAPTTFGLLLIRTLPHRRCGSFKPPTGELLPYGPCEGSPDLFELLPRPQVGRVRLSGIDLRPCGPGNLADINVAARVHRKTVRRQELAQLGPRRRVAEAPEQLALAIDDADPRSEIGNVAADRGSRPT